MKCYLDRADTDKCEQISLSEALLLIAKHHDLGGYLAAADMLEKSSHALTVLVEDGCVWIEDDVPVLDIDRVLTGWWYLRTQELPTQWIHLIISCTKDPLTRGMLNVQYVGEDHAFYATSEEALATFKDQGHVSTTTQSKDTLQHGEEPER